jgi:hypothetical protein
MLCLKKKLDNFNVEKKYIKRIVPGIARTGTCFIQKIYAPSVRKRRGAYIF